MRLSRVPLFACGAALLASLSPHMSVALAQSAPPVRATTATTQITKRPLIGLSFLSGATPNGRRALERTLRALKPKKKKLLDSLFTTEQPRDDMVSATIPKTIFWVTPLYVQLTKELGEGAVILNPLIADEGTNGELVVRSTSDLSAAPVEVYFQAYQPPDAALLPHSEGSELASLIVVSDARQKRSNEQALANILGKVPEGHLTSWSQRFIKKRDFNALLDQSPFNIPAQDNINQKLSKKIIEDASTIFGSDTEADHKNRYALILGTEYSPIVERFLAAETKFRMIQSDRVARYVWNSPLGDSLQALLRAEQKGIEARDKAGLAAALGAAQGGGLSSFLQSARTGQDSTARITQDMASATFPVLAQQVRFTSDIAQSNAEIEASSLQDLRQKIRGIAARAGKNP